MRKPNKRALVTLAVVGLVAWIGQASGGDVAEQRVAALEGSSDASPAAQQDSNQAELELRRGYPPMAGRRNTAATQAPPQRYGTLLKTIEVPADQQTYGDFYNFGYYAGTSYAGHDDLPTGYWVYVSPNWLIYRDAPGTPGNPGFASRGPNWEPAQATGGADTPEAGDRPTAWASQTPDGQREWLEVTFDAPQKAAALLVYESYNPGALDRVTVYSADGREAEVWAGADPTKPTEQSGVSAISIKTPFDVARAKLHLNSPAVSGWNEIDAVGLVDASGKTHWATGATASSTYADLGRLPIVREEGERFPRLQVR